MLKRIGSNSRRELEKILNTKVFLELFVKVQAGWRDSRHFVEQLDWHRQLEEMSEGLIEAPRTRQAKRRSNPEGLVLVL